MYKNIDLDNLIITLLSTYIETAYKLLFELFNIKFNNKKIIDFKQIALIIKKDKQFNVNVIEIKNFNNKVII